MKIITIIGARPQFIKAAAFSRTLKELTNWQEVIVHTGQHHDANMSEVFFREMDIPEPNYHLGIHTLPRTEMIARMKLAIAAIIAKEKPDLVLVYGDTNSTLAGALAANELGIKLAHVEAGLRSFNSQMPEELNRVETDRLSDILFVPAVNAAENLKKEGIEEERLFTVGDIMFDALKYYSSKAEVNNLPPNLSLNEPYVLLTLHRQENTDDRHRLEAIFKAVNTIAESIRVILPLHPRTRLKLQEFNLTTKATIISPVGYFDMLKLIQNSALVMTDSGGLQKEAFYLRKFCITLRDETEWTELVDIGANEVCGTHVESILNAFHRFSNMEFNFDQNPYGEGDAAEQIIKTLQKSFG